MSGTTVSPTLSDVYTALRSFLIGVVPANVPVIKGLPNRSAMPQPEPGFLTMQALLVSRLRWNVDTWDTASPTPTTMSAEEGLEVRIQIDCYGASSSSWAASISTLLRDDYGVQAMLPNVVPLYADEAKMVPLTDSEQQYEERWMIDARLQWNPVTTFTQTFANVPATIDIIDVNATYPP